MSSLETIKQQLVRQKQALEARGFPVATANNNPSPTEITAAIEDINLDFSVSTAVESDVVAGKTFYSQSHELKTGTLDNSQMEALQQSLLCFIGGVGTFEIIIPETIDHIRDYAYYTELVSAQGEGKVFHATDLTIPANITQIGTHGFYNTNITGKVTIGETCTKIGVYGFAYCALKELESFSGLGTGSGIFERCPNLEKVVIHDNVADFGYKRHFNRCTKLKSITFPPTLASFSGDDIYYCNAIEFIQFTNPTAPTFKTYPFSYARTALIAVPYQSYDSYYNATNFTYYNNPSCGWGDFEQGDTLPTSIEGYTMVWYTSYADLNAAQNPVTVCPASGTLFAAMTAIPTEEEGSTETE